MVRIFKTHKFQRHKKMKRGIVLTLMINTSIQMSLNPCVNSPINMFQNQAPEFHNKEESDVKVYNRVAGSSQVSSRNGSRGGRRKQSFQATLTDTMAGFREFQRQSLQQMRPNSFDQEDYDECEMAIKIFESIEVQKNTGFYWACIQAFKDERFWRKYFIDRADDSDEDKLQFLQALTGYTPDGEYVGKRLNSNQNCSSPNFGFLLLVVHLLVLITHGVKLQMDNGVMVLNNGALLQTLSNGVHHQVFHNGVLLQMLSMGSIIKCSTMGHSSKRSATEYSTKCPTVEHSTKCSTMGFIRKCSTMGYGEKYSKWGSSSNANQWDPSSSAQQWGSSPNANQWVHHQVLNSGFHHQMQINGFLRQMFSVDFH
ncbi:unnamed protein product [Microthlaspi erraticum]|uniref:Uncharacterized protein n=1 Tax=Microthlaspi erraticum TaxID=1685480 RepID=A0A6D2HDB0_9BRAS|nr:unnamed protein product [Microthlaspi erraticum]